MIIGVDFDNTIVCYHALFYHVALDQGLIPANLAPMKDEVRNYLRQIGKELDWTVMQGYVYGERMAEAEPFPGVLTFFQTCRRQNVPVYIISHKTRQPFIGPRYDLHQAAWDWLAANDFLSPVGAGLTAANIFFELTKEEKIQRIAALQCTHFVDDLPEFLTDIRFPAWVQKILFNPDRRTTRQSDLIQMESWTEIEAMLLKS